VKERHFIFIRNRFWPLIQAGRILTIGSKVSSWYVKMATKRLVGFVCFRWRCGACKGNQPTKIALGCSTMSCHHSGVGFVRFG